MNPVGDLDIRVGRAEGHQYNYSKRSHNAKLGAGFHEFANESLDGVVVIPQSPNRVLAKRGPLREFAVEHTRGDAGNRLETPAASAATSPAESDRPAEVPA